MSKIIQGKHLHGDMFGDDVPEKYQYAILKVIADCPQNNFILITKKPQNVRRMYKPTDDVPLRRLGRGDCLPNLWLGVTVENQQAADARIPALLQVPAAIRFVSVKPMLGPVDLTNIQFDRSTRVNVLEGCGISLHSTAQSTPNTFCEKIDWVICGGGETGPGARPVHPDWVRSLRDQCQAAKTPFLFAGWGGCSGDKSAGRLLDGQEWDQYPDEYLGEYPEED